MISPLCIPLPLEDYASHRVEVYFYSGRWIPLKSYTLVDAIALHWTVKRLGKEIYIFPPDTDPNRFSNLDVLLSQ